jgi:hypothetical protein
MFLTITERHLYARLVREYETGQWHKFCSLDTFLKRKYKKSGYQFAYYNVWMYAQNDY